MQDEAELSAQTAAETPRSVRKAVLSVMQITAVARLAATVTLFVVGVILVMLGWYGAAHTNILTEQIPYLISGGLLGLGLIIVAGFLASSASAEMQSERMRRDIVEAIRTQPFASDASGPAPTANGHAYFAVKGGLSYHQAGCPILEGKDVKAISGKAKAPLAACKLCCD